MIRLTDSLNPTRRSRPNGVMAIEIWNFVGDQHPAEEQYRSVAIATLMKEKIQFSADDVGKTAWYMFRYMNIKGQFGPWSSVYTETVTG